MLINEHDNENRYAIIITLILEDNTFTRKFVKTHGFPILHVMVIRLDICNH